MLLSSFTVALAVVSTLFYFAPQLFSPAVFTSEGLQSVASPDGELRASIKSGLEDSSVAQFAQQAIDYAAPVVAELLPNPPRTASDSQSRRPFR